jgi:hypothetical protein
VGNDAKLSDFTRSYHSNNFLRKAHICLLLKVRNFNHVEGLILCHLILEMNMSDAQVCKARHHIEKEMILLSYTYKKWINSRLISNNTLSQTPRDSNLISCEL